MEKGSSSRLSTETLVPREGAACAPVTKEKRIAAAADKTLIFLFLFDSIDLMSFSEAVARKTGALSLSLFDVHRVMDAHVCPEFQLVERPSRPHRALIVPKTVGTFQPAVRMIECRHAQREHPRQNLLRLRVQRIGGNRDRHECHAGPGRNVSGVPLPKTQESASGKIARHHTRQDRKTLFYFKKEKRLAAAEIGALDHGVVPKNA